MNLYTAILRDGRVSVKIFVGVLGFVCIILFFQGQVAAQAAQFKTAFIRASDGKVYQIHYQKPLSIENFLISNTNGDPVPRDVAAELYIAARFLNQPPFAFAEGELKRWVEDEYRHTAKWKEYHSVATYVGSLSAGFLTGQLTSSIGITAGIVKSKAGQHTIQALTTITTFVGEEAVLAQAYAITDVFVKRTVSKRRIVDNLLSSANAGTEINIDNLKSAHNALLQSARYGLWVKWMVEEYLTLPSRWERLWTFAKTIFPLTSLGQFFASAGQNIEDLRTLQRIFEESDRQIAAEASATVDSIFDEDIIASRVSILEDGGFFQSKGPRLIASIRDQMLTVGNPSTVLDLSDYFRDPNGDTLTYEVWADDYDEIESERNGSVIEITPIAAGGTIVRIIATDPSSGLEAAERFFVFVTDPPRRVQNQKPEPVDSVPDQTVRIGESLPPLNISGYFQDPEDGILNYHAWSNPIGIVKVEPEGSQITILPITAGSTTVIVRAMDTGDLQAFQRISVTVRASQNQPPVPEPVTVDPPLPSQGLKKGDAVIVQNTSPSALNIRGGPSLGWAQKGLASDGATGTIMDESQQANGYTWWKVKWDPSNKIRWTHQPANNSGWSVEAVGSTGYLASRPPAPVVQSFDLAIQSFTVNKTSLTPGESFTLNVTVRNDGPHRSVTFDLSYYHSSVQGRSPTDPPQLQGTVSLNPIAPGKSTTKSIRLNAPSTPKTYYYGGWLTANTGDTDIYNDVATEVGVTVTATTVQTSDSSDLVVESISANKVSLAPGEDFRLDAVVRNQGKADAPSTYLRYYRSSDSTISANDTEVGEDRMTTPDAGETYDRWEKITAPDTPGIYYYIACVESVESESNTDNNCSESIQITVQTALSPDLVIESISANKVALDPNDTFGLSTVVRNQGGGGARSTKLRYYRSSDATFSADDTEVNTRNVRSLEADETSDGSKTLRAPDAFGVYYYIACVDSVESESNTDNNCSETIQITVQAPSLPDLIVESISVSNDPLVPGESFTLSVTVRNNGTSKSYSTWLRYHGPGGHEIGKNRVDRLSPTVVSNQNINLEAPDEVGTYYYEACVDSVHGETEVHNNCSTRIAITVGTPANRVPALLGAITARSLTAGGSSAQMDLSGYFRDPDDDRLTYSVSSDVTRIATVSISGSQITITPKSAGIATITVTASDGTLMATQRFSVTVTATQIPNRTPVPAGTISPRTLAEGDPSEHVDISGNFRDPDGDRLSYTVRSDNTSVARVSVSGTQVTIAPKSAGSATITVTASDGELTATQSFSVTVTAAPVANRAPVTVGTISPRTLTVGDSSERVFVSGNFQDPDNDSLIYTAQSDNTSVATVNFSGSLITVSARGVGRATIAVTASDGELTATQSFSVTVTATPVANRAPVSVGSISSRTLAVGGSAERVNVSSYFRDPDNDSLVYTVDSDNTTIATVDISISQVTITPQGVGSATITVTASDGNLTVTQDFTATVTGGQTRQIDTQSIQDICDRTQQLLDEILIEMDVDDCADLGSNDLSSITSLDLHDAGITILKESDFQGLTGLDDLDLSDNSLRSLPVSIFNGLTALFSLELYNNSLSSLPVSVFNGLGALDFLDLAGNSLSALSVGVFDGLSTLRRLELEENSLGSLPLDIFDELSSLRMLDLRDNSLRSLPVGVFNGLSALEDLDLRKNSLSSLPASVFDGLSVLEDLDLRENSLSSLPASVFDGLDALETLDLEDNRFTTLPKGVFDDILDTLKSNSSNLNLDDSLKTTFGFSTTAQDAAEGETVRVVVNLGHALPVAVRVPYTVGGTATAADYTNLQTPTELLFLAGETSKEIVFTLLEDADTTAETVFLTLGELKDVKLRKSDGTGLDAQLSAYTLLNASQQRVHTVTVTTGGEGVSRPMYWTGGDNKIRRSKMDGTLVQVLFDGGNPRGIALDISGGKMYWIDTRIDAVRRANLDGSGVVDLVTDLGSPTGLTLDISGGKMYWTDTSTDKIQRSNLNGSGVEDLVTGLGSPSGLALDVSGGKMYWTDTSTDKIQRSNLNGSGVEDLVTGLSSPRGLALDVSDGKMYWTDTSTNKIQRANLNGTNIEDLVTTINIGAEGLALDVSGGKMYWADNPEDKICRANLDGSQIERLYAGGYPIGIALAVGSGATANAAPLAASTNLAPVLSSETTLLPNYPNPFNPETWIPYRLAASADVSISIYAADGKLVRTLDLGQQSVGIYESRGRAAYWDGRNALGEPVASGVYFYTLTAGDFTATRKMLIRK